MTFNQFFLQQLNEEAATTRKMLSIIPDDKYDWKPHEKSMVMRSLATHIAELPTWVTMVFNTDELDFAKDEYKPVQINNTKELVAYFEKCLEEGRQSLTDANEAFLDKPWTLRNGETIYSTSPKRDVIRMALSQIIHHRAQLGVYLRLLNIPIPGSYGPSADDMTM
jgi:uncharacterized damage-inducible protein DinB